MIIEKQAYNFILVMYKSVMMIMMHKIDFDYCIRHYYAYRYHNKFFSALPYPVDSLVSRPLQSLSKHIRNKKTSHVHCIGKA